MLQQAEMFGQAHIVSWMPSGKSFRVHDREAFSKEVLAEYFRSRNYRSFQRNLSVYQFSRIWSGPEKGAYCHESFVRHDRKLCTMMKRHVTQKKESSPDPIKTSPSIDAIQSEDTIKDGKVTAGKPFNLGPPVVSTAGFDFSALDAHHALRSQQDRLPANMLHTLPAATPVSAQSSRMVGTVDYLPTTGLLVPVNRRGESGVQSSTVPDPNTPGAVAVYFGGTTSGPDPSHARSSSAPASALSVSSSRTRGINIPSSSEAQAVSGESMARFIRSMATSPCPYAFEDDDPFLLDRLWSQTLNVTTSSKNPSLAVRPTTFGEDSWGNLMGIAPTPFRTTQGEAQQQFSEYQLQLLSSSNSTSASSASNRLMDPSSARNAQQGSQFSDMTSLPSGSDRSGMIDNHSLGAVAERSSSDGSGGSNNPIPFGDLW